MGFSQHFPRRETFSQPRVQVGQVIPLFTTRVEMDCYTNNLTRLTVGVCMKVRFKSKVTRGLFRRFATRVRRFAALSRLSHAEKNQEKPLGPG